MKTYIETDKHLHWLCQLIAKANRSFVPKKADDSHTNFYFDSLGDRIVGRWIVAPKGKILLTLNLANLRFEWLDSSYKMIAFFSTIGKKRQDVEQKIAGHLAEFGLKPDGFTDKLHFEIPVYSFVSEAIQTISEANMEEWKYYRNLANQACNLLLGHLQVEGEARIWPHHFDTGIYAVTHKKIGIGFGLAMSDKMVGEPYFYMTAQIEDGSISYDKLPELKPGKWIITENWKGAVLPLTDLKQLPREEQKNEINSFLKKVVDWFVRKSE